ncbi:LytR/AlgR family response regulator transcription factor, partial [Streptococcus pyogenes]
MVKAFILDDQDINIQLLKVQLGRYFPGIELSGYSTGPEAALRQIRTDMPDLLFLDIQMPGMDGFDFLEQIRDISP